MSAHDRLESIFYAVLAIGNPQDRAAYLAKACGDDRTMRDKLERMLAAQAAGFLEAPADGLEATIQFTYAERVGAQIGPYKLLQQIGEGGMGAVFMAEQSKPIERKVALKIIKQGMDTHQVIVRFEAERQALALMDHPNIARVFEAGMTESGRPYFVMELVRGVPITEYCDGKRLSLQERLQLFMPVCQAVQHAHQKGIIHRDIKPSNVLVAEYDNRAVPKVIDFGVAKATAQRLTEKTMFTEYGQVVGTIEYMSPEQAKLNQLDVDTRSDIYSLGVLLYELLSGSTPFDRERLQEAAFDEVLRIIREEEPPKPSTKLGSSQSLPAIAVNRQAEPAYLSKAMRGELDWIVMKCLEKDRTRRYETASGLAYDIEKFLGGEPVDAGPPSAMYRLRKLATKYRVPLIVAACFALVSVLGTALSTWQAIRAVRAEYEARRNEQVAGESARTARRSQFQAEQAMHAERRARMSEVEQRKKVEQLQTETRRSLYSTRISITQNAWSAGQFSRMRQLLNSDRPRANETDLRTFEWWYLSRLASPWRAELTGLIAPVADVAISPDGETVVACDRQGSLSAWSSETGAPRWSHKGDPNALSAVRFSRDGSTLIAGGSEHRVQLLSATTGKLNAQWTELPGDVLALETSPDGKAVALGYRAGTGVEIRSLATGEVVATLSGFRGDAVALSYDASGSVLAAGGPWEGIGMVTIWETKSGAQRPIEFKSNKLRLPKTQAELPPGAIAGAVSGVAWSPDSKSLFVSFGQNLVLGTADASIIAIDAQTGREIREFDDSQVAVTSLAVAADGREIIAGRHDEAACVWDIPTGRTKHRLVGHHGPVTRVAFTNEKSVYLTGGVDHAVRLWSPPTKDFIDLGIHTPREIAVSRTSSLWATLCAEEIVVRTGVSTPMRAPMMSRISIPNPPIATVRGRIIRRSSRFSLFRSPSHRMLTPSATAYNHFVSGDAFQLN